MSKGPMGHGPDDYPITEKTGVPKGVGIPPKKEDVKVSVPREVKPPTPAPAAPPSPPGHTKESTPTPSGEGAAPPKH